jgi:hypothetical protein
MMPYCGQGWPYLTKRAVKFTTKTKISIWIFIKWVIHVAAVAATGHVAAVAAAGSVAACMRPVLSYVLVRASHIGCIAIDSAVQLSCCLIQLLLQLLTHAADAPVVASVVCGKPSASSTTSTAYAWSLYGRWYHLLLQAASTPPAVAAAVTAAAEVAA